VAEPELQEPEPQEPEPPEIQPEDQAVSDMDTAAPLETDSMEPQADAQATTEQAAPGPAETQPESSKRFTRYGREVKPPSNPYGGRSWGGPAYMAVRTLSKSVQGLMSRLPKDTRLFSRGGEECNA